MFRENHHERKKEEENKNKFQIISRPHFEHQQYQKGSKDRKRERERECERVCVTCPSPPSLLSCLLPSLLLSLSSFIFLFRAPFLSWKVVTFFRPFLSSSFFLFFLFDFLSFFSSREKEGERRVSQECFFSFSHYFERRVELFTWCFWCCVMYPLLCQT